MPVCFNVGSGPSRHRPPRFGGGAYACCGRLNGTGSRTQGCERPFRPCNTHAHRPSPTPRRVPWAGPIGPAYAAPNKKRVRRRFLAQPAALGVPSRKHAALRAVRASRVSGPRLLGDSGSRLLVFWSWGRLTPLVLSVNPGARIGYRTPRVCFYRRGGWDPEVVVARARCRHHGLRERPSPVVRPGGPGRFGQPRGGARAQRAQLGGKPGLRGQPPVVLIFGGGEANASRGSVPNAPLVGGIKPGPRYELNRIGQYVTA